MPKNDELIAAVKRLVESIANDDNGTLIGGKWIGGQGGLLSKETRRRADAVIRLIHKIEKDGDNEDKASSLE